MPSRLQVIQQQLGVTTVQRLQTNLKKTFLSWFSFGSNSLEKPWGSPKDPSAGAGGTLDLNRAGYLRFELLGDLGTHFSAGLNRLRVLVRPGHSS